MGSWCLQPRYWHENELLGQVTIRLKSLPPNGLNCHCQLSEVDNTRVFWLFPQEFHAPRRCGGGRKSDCQRSRGEAACATIAQGVAQFPQKILGPRRIFSLAVSWQNEARQGPVLSKVKRNS